MGVGGWLPACSQDRRQEDQRGELDGERGDLDVAVVEFIPVVFDGALDGKERQEMPPELAAHGPRAIVRVLGLDIADAGPEPTE